MKKTLVGTMLVLALLLSACGIASELGAVNETAEGFMTALRDGDYASGYALLGSDLQAELGGEEGWAQFAAPRNFEEWKWTNTEFENDTGKAEGEATLGTEIYKIILVEQKIGDSWKVVGLDFAFDRNK